MMYLRLILVVILAFTAANCSTTPPPPQMATSPIMGPKTIFYDDFSSRKNEWQQDKGIWAISPSDGFLTQRTSDERHLNALFWVTNPQMVDATIETYVRIKEEHPAYMDMGTDRDRGWMFQLRNIIGAGIIFRMQDANNYYMFRLAGEEGAVLGKMVNGEWFDLKNPRAADFLTGQRIQFRESNWYKLKIEAYDNRIVCSIQDVPVINVKDDTFSSGRFGLCTFKAFADFDYYKVYNKQETEVKGQ